MIDLSRAPAAALIRKADVMRWLPGLRDEEWKKIQPHLRAIVLPGHVRPYYSRNEVYAKVVRPIEAAAADVSPPVS